MANPPAQLPGETLPEGESPFEHTWRRNLVFVWIGVFTGMLGANFVFPFMPFFIEDLGIDGDSKVALWVGITGSATGLSLTLTAPIWGALGDRYGRKAMMLRALIGAGCVILLMGVSQNVWHLLGLRFGLGLFAGTMGAAAALVAATTPKEKVGYALGALQTSQFTANMMGPLVGGIAAAGLGLRPAFFACGAFYLIGAVATAFYVREAPESLRQAPDPNAEPVPDPGIIGNLKIVVSERQIVVMLLFLFVLWLSTTFVRPVMPLSVGDFAGANDKVSLWLPWGSILLDEKAASGVLFGVIGAGSTIAALSLSPVANRIGYRNAVLIAAVATGVLHIPVALADGFTPFLLFFGAVGLFQGAMVPGMSALIAAAVPQGKHGSAFGLAASMQSLAIMLGPLAGGGVAALVSVEAVYITLGVLVLAAAVAGRVYIDDPRQHQLA